MKILHFVFFRLTLILLTLMTAWGVFFYFAIMEEVIDETDDTLENYRDILVRKALADPSILNTHGMLMTNYSFTPITKEQARGYKERFYNSTVYIEFEDEEEPVRVMKSCFMMPGGQYYELELMISTLEREDMVEAILGYLLTLYVLLLLTMLLVSRFTLKKSFRPLDQLMKWLDTIEPGKPAPPLQQDTNIKEFKRLSEAAVDMSNRSFEAYKEQKQFIENASHELQTPLAIVRAKVELLAENATLAEDQMKELDGIYAALGRAVRLNKSLLLLSRIENRHYTEKDHVELNSIAKTILDDLKEVYEDKHLVITLTENGLFEFKGSVGLTQILITNLLKNAMLHTNTGGDVALHIDTHSFIISNSGEAPLDNTQIFKRFYHVQKEKKDSTGLGLAIAKSIADTNHFSLTYRWEGRHCFVLQK